MSGVEEFWKVIRIEVFRANRYFTRTWAVGTLEP